MPLSLEELLQRTRNSLGGFIQTGITGATNPLQTGKGFIKGGLSALAGIGHSVANIAQSMAPEDVNVPFATEHPTTIPERFATGLSNLTLGFSDLFANRVIEAAGERALLPGQARYDSPKTGDEVLDIAFEGLAGGLKDLLPVAEIKAAAEGQTDPEALGESIFSGLGKSAVLAGLLPRTRFPLKPAERPPRFLTTGDIESIKSDRAAKLTQKTPASKPEPEGLTTGTPPTATKPSPLILPPEDIATLSGEAVNSAVFQEFAKRIRRDPTNATDIRKFQAVAETLRQMGDEAPSQIVKDLAEKHGVPLESATTGLADALEYSVSQGGKTLDVISKLKFELEALAADGSESALQSLKALESFNKAVTEGPFGRWGLVKEKFFRPFTSALKKSVVSQPVTTIRNFEVGVANSISQLYGDIATGMIEKGVGIVKGEHRPLGEYFSDALHTWGAMVDRFSPKARSKLNEIFDALPLEKARFEATNLAADGILKTSAELIEGANKKGGLGRQIADVVINHNRIAEVEQGKFFFQARLESNMARIGYKTPDAILEHLRNPTELTEGGKRTPAQLKFDSALQDAFDHAYKQGFRYNPKVGAPKQILDFYRANPWMNLVGPMFPRFLINQYLWLTERSPLNWMDMFNPEFKKQLSAGLNGELTSAQAARHLGRAVEGIINLGAAWNLRQMPIAGGKYYELKFPNSDGTESVVDLRSYQPFRMYLAMAEYLQASVEGRPMNMSPSEATDEFLGARRLEEVPIFALPDLIRSLQSENPEIVKNVIERPAGQILAGFFTPLRAVMDVAGGVGQILNNEVLKSQTILRDSAGQEKTGPLISNTPIANTLLPARVDPFTGQPLMTEHPFLRQFGGVTARRQTKLEQIIKGTPKVAVGDLIGDFGNQRANELISKGIGNALMLPTGEGETLGDGLAELIQGFEDPSLRKEVIKEIFTQLREAAREIAEAQDPLAFVDHYINSSSDIPSGMKEKIRKDLMQGGVHSR